MASQSGEHNELEFTGESAEEAEGFVHAVHRRAYAAGRQKDNTWMAEFAFPCFTRKALRWYDTLDEETQNDWKLLRRAILAEFTASLPEPATVPSAAPALVSSPSNPTPAAPPPSAVTVEIGRIRVDSVDRTKGGINAASGLGAVATDSSKATIFEVDSTGPSAAQALVSSPSSTTPAAPLPSAVTVKIGRIRVDSVDRTKGGYFGINAASGLGAVATDSSKATIFEVDSLGRTIKFRGGGESLAIRGHPNSPSLDPRTSGFGCMTNSSTDFGAQWNYTWKIAEDGTITVMLLRTDGSQYDATFLTTASVLGQIIHVPADTDVFLTRYASSWKSLRLRLELLP